LGSNFAHAARQKRALEFGATDIVDSRDDQAVEDVKKLTDGVGVDAALECVGTNEAMQTALAICLASQETPSKFRCTGQ
jgi:Zn-dependent alcohol dehydrogenase